MGGEGVGRILTTKRGTTTLSSRIGKIAHVSRRTAAVRSYARRSPGEEEVEEEALGPAGGHGTSSQCNNKPCARTAIQQQQVT
ncbi:unnamed protein product [Arctogadus glacialis]